MVHKRKFFYILKDESLKTGDGTLAELLLIPHFGTYIGDVVLLDILYPVSKSWKVIKKNTFYLLAMDGLKSKNGGCLSDAKYYGMVHWHVDGQGRISYLSVPSCWMEEKVKTPPQP